MTTTCNCPINAPADVEREHWDGCPALVAQLRRQLAEAQAKLDYYEKGNYVLEVEAQLAEAQRERDEARARLARYYYLVPIEKLRHARFLSRGWKRLAKKFYRHMRDSIAAAMGGRHG